LSKGIVAFCSAAVLAAALTASCLAASTGAAVESAETATGKVLMVVADYLDIGDIKEMEYLSKLAGKSNVALMNNRQPGKAGSSKSKLVIGSGKRLELNSSMVLGGSEESYLKLYSMESGREPVSGSLAYTDIYKLKSRNGNSEYIDYIGYLGDVINKNNGTACFLGNADTDEPNRSSMLIAMDSSGGVDAGETDNILTYDKLFPYGKRTDYNKLAELYKQYLPASSFIVIETGDMERLEKFRYSMSEESYNHYKHSVLKNIDNFMEELISHGDFKTLIFISTYPSKEDVDGNNMLTPVVVYEKGDKGVLYSSSTRREGIILNTDLADFILNRLGYINYSAVSELKRENALYFLENMNGNIVRTSVLRAPVLASYAVMVMAVLLIQFVTIAFLEGKYKTILSMLCNILGYMMLSFPIVFLYLPSYKQVDSPALYIVIAFAASALLSLLLQAALKGKIKVMLTICLLLLIGLSMDITAGSPMIKQSVLGYDPIIGARFYGIGNEYAGMFIGCSLMAFGCIQELSGKKLSKASAILYFVFCLSFLGLTFLGANFGEALAGAAGYLLAYFLVYGIKFSKGNIALGVLILGSTATALIIADTMGIRSPSHMGSLVKETKANGIGVITGTIQRKISMNLRLIRYTIWTKVLLSIIIIISIMFYKPVKILQELFARYKYLRYSWISIAVSSIMGLGVNDSGIVAAATTMIYAAFTMLVMCIEERNIT
jgi:hypothetical protein